MSVGISGKKISLGISEAGLEPLLTTATVSVENVHKPSEGKKFIWWFLKVTWEKTQYFFIKSLKHLQKCCVGVLKSNQMSWIVQ